MSTDYTSIIVIPVVITDCAPRSIDAHLNSTKPTVSCITFQSNAVVGTWYYAN